MRLGRWKNSHEPPSVPMASTPSRASRRTVRAGRRHNGDGHRLWIVDHRHVPNGGQHDEPGAGDSTPGEGPVDGEGQDRVVT